MPCKGHRPRAGGFHVGRLRAMTLVVTTASARGITVVGDRAVTRQSDAGVEILEARKVWYSPKANLALAFWGNANFPGSESLEA